MQKKKIPFEKKVLALLLLIILFVSASGVLVYSNLSNIIDDITEEARPDEKLIILKGMMFDISDAENAAKSYGYTKEVSYLDQFEQKTADVSSKVDELRSLSQNDDALLSYCDSLDGLTAAKFLVLEELLILQDQFKVDEVLDRVIENINVESGDTDELSTVETVQEDTASLGFFKRLSERRKRKKEEKEQAEVVDDTAEEVGEETLELLEEQVFNIREQSINDQEQLKLQELKLIQEDHRIMVKITSIIRQMEQDESAKMLEKLDEADADAASTKNLVGGFSLLVVLFLLAAAYIIWSYVNRNNAYKKALKAAKDEMQFKNEEVRDSILYAQRIQTAILPDQKKVDKCIPESFIWYKPKDLVAGDFYWMVQLDQKVLFAVADCTGHGVPGAMVSVVCSNALNRAVREFGLQEPAKILEKARELVIETLDEGELKVSDGMDIALCAFNKDTKMLQYAGANNSLYLVKNGTIHEIKADKQPVGRYTNARPFTNHVVQLESNDQIYLFTDGMADQFGGPKGKKFKYKPFRELLLKSSDHTIAQQKTQITQAFEDWRGGHEQVDDVCVLGVRVS